MVTVNIQLGDILGMGAPCEMVFRPMDAPYISGGLVVAPGARSVTLDAQGRGTITLVHGRYWVHLSGIDSNTKLMVITVPDETATYLFATLVTGGALVPPTADTLAFSAVTMAGRALVTAANAAAQRALLGVSRSVSVIVVTDAEARLAILADTLIVGDIVKQTAWTENPTNPGEYEHAVYGVVDPSAEIATERFVHLGSFTAVPSNLTLPTITGGAFVGATLTGVSATWTDAPTGFEHKWFSTAAPYSEYTEIEGETGTTYTLASGDDGKKFKYAQRTQNAVGWSEWVESAATVEVTAITFPLGPVAYWRLNEESGTRVDATGNGNDLTDNNGVVGTSDADGPYASFDAQTGTYLSLPFSSGVSLLIPDAATISCWAKFADLTDRAAVIGDWNPGSGAWLISSSEEGGAGKLSFIGASFAGNPSVFASDDTIQDRWYNLVLVLDNVTPSFKGYIDGILIGEVLGHALYQEGGIVVGNIGYQDEPLTGGVKNIGLWQRALTTEEVELIATGATYPV